MKRLALAIGLVLTVGACVPTVQFSALPPGRDAILQAQAAERSLQHPMTVHIAARHPGSREEVSFCVAAGGRAVTVEVTRVEDERVCGFERGASASEKTEQCWRFADLRSVGEPRDATAIGYYPVRGYLSCREDT